jgi:DNA replication and repair protein RecF
MSITALWLTDFRCFEEASFEPEPTGLTVLRGENGVGKTSVLEAIGWLATERSFRGAGRETLVRNGCPRAVLRAESSAAGRPMLLEAALPVDGPARLQCNRQTVRRRSELAEALRVSVFSPDDLEIVQGGPAGRRQYLDDAMVALQSRHESLLDEVDRVLRQRGALLRQAGGRMDAEVASTLEVWDSRLATSGEALATARQMLVERLDPLVRAACAGLAPGGEDSVVQLRYRRSWEGGLAEALEKARPEDLRRQVTTVGPHRDDLELTLSGRPARSQASQGEQRTVALGLRLAGHQLAADGRPEPPVLLLDDVFSELDHFRAAALVAQLPAGQVLLTTAVDPPDVVSPDRVVAVAGGRLVGTGRP